MQIPRLSLLLATMALAVVAWPAGPARLVVDVAPAVASIQPLAEGRRLLRLPALEFAFGIGAGCGPDQAVTSVSISVADTRKTLSGAEFRDDAVTNMTVRLPARQIAPIAVDDFCPETQSESSSLLIRDAVTAQVSLRCASAEEESITYASQSLDVTVVCDAGPEAQGSESESTDR
jgi:hypothetical protein